MRLKNNALQKMISPVIDFTGDTLRPKGMVQLKVTFKTPPWVMDVMVDFLVIDVPSAYNAILGRDTLNKIGDIVSFSHLKIKFYTNHRVGEECRQ